MEIRRESATKRAHRGALTVKRSRKPEFSLFRRHNATSMRLNGINARRNSEHDVSSSERDKRGGRCSVSEGKKKRIVAKMSKRCLGGANSLHDERNEGSLLSAMKFRARFSTRGKFSRGRA